MNRQKHSKILYKTDSKGKMRVWTLDIYEAQDGRVYQKIVSGLEDGNTTDRVKEIKDSKVEAAWDRAVKLQRNAIVKKKREGYQESRDGALNAPTLTKPMKAQTYKPDGKVLQNRLYVQPKINGLRCLYFREQDKLFSKSGIPYEVPEIMDDVRTLSDALGGATIDGELFIPKTPVATIKSVVNTLGDIRREQLTYQVFDILTDDTQKERIEKLRVAYYETKRKGTMVKLVPTMLCSKGPDELQYWYEHYLYMGHEGLMIRYPDAPYESDKRSKYLLKWKPVYDDEYEIVHITYENRAVDGVQAKLVEFHCYDPISDTRFKAIPKWDVQRRFQFYKDHKDTDLIELLDKLPPLLVEFRERTVNGTPFHAVGIDFREEGY